MLVFATEENVLCRLNKAAVGEQSKSLCHQPLRWPPTKTCKKNDKYKDKKQNVVTMTLHHHQHHCRGCAQVASPDLCHHLRCTARDCQALCYS